MMAEATEIRIDIVSDVVCPWCAIGYEQLRRAIGQLGDRAEVGIRWHPFELAPDMPREGMLLSDYGRMRYGATPEQSMANRAKMTALGAELGIDFRWTPESRIANTFKAHQLLLWAGEQGKQTALKLALFRAHFTDQADIADETVLLDTVEAAGLDRAEAAAVLADARYADAVRAEEAHWQNQNITGVPAYIVNGKYMIPGAQDAETFVRVLERVLEREAA